jgi:septum formation protein
MTTFILASGSPRRSELLRTCGIKISAIHPPKILEIRNQDESPLEYASRLAVEKSKAIHHNNAVVLSADTIVCLENRVFEKPTDDQNAFDILSTLSGGWHDVITAWAISIHPPIADGEAIRISHSGSTTSKVRFRSFKEAEIRSYIQTGEGRDKAGSYGIQGKGAALVEEISGDFSNVVGLPIKDVLFALNSLGVHSEFAQ